MTGKSRLLALLVTAGLVLASCSINAPATEQAALTVLQNTTPGVQPVIAQQTIQALAIALSTTANPTTYDQAGRQIVFTYTIRNSGSASLGPTQCTVTDTLIAATPFNCGDPNITLAPNATVTCTATYTTNQADANALSITSTASATCSGAAPASAPPVTVNRGTVPPANPSNLTPGSTISHTVVDGEWIWQLGRCYGVSPASIIAANTQLDDPAEISKGMVLTIPNLGSAGTIYGLPCVVEHTVKSGDTWASIAQLYNADPTIMQMVDRNSLTVGSKVFVPRNSASAGGTSTVTRGLALTTSANPTTYEQLNQQITFTYVIRNSGNTTLGPDQFRVTDTLISPTPFNCGNPNTTIAPNATVTCTATYSVNQADLGAVSITNVATASGGGVGPSAAASTTVNRRAAALSVTTSANPTTYDQVNQQITFQYVIMNSGGSALGPAQFMVTDTLINATPFACGVPNTTLAPGTTVTCSAIYTINQNDMNAVSVSNLANASGGGVSTAQPASATVTKAVKSISLTTTATPTTYNQAGQQITFQYVIKNTGTATLGPGQFAVSDSLTSATPISCGAADMTLAPTATVTCSATYTIKPEDVNAVSVTSVSIATGPGVGPSAPTTTTVNKQ